MTQHLISTRARPQPCPRCRTSTLIAHAEGLPVRVDVTPIDTSEEIAAITEGRETYTMIRCGELVHRDEHRIRGGLLEGTTHRQHRCPDQEADRCMRAGLAKRRRHGKEARHQRREQQIMKEQNRDITGQQA